MIMHKNKALLVFLSVFAAVSPAWAQNCSFVEEAIVNLYVPRAGSYNVWDTVYGDLDHTEKFYDAYPLEGGATILMVGDSEGSEDGAKNVFLIAVGRNGRVLWEKPLEIKGYKQLIKLEPQPRGFLIMANIEEGKQNKIWIGAFDLEGGRLWQTSLQGQGGMHLYAHDIEHDAERKSFVVAMARAGAENSGEPLTTMLYRINESGRTLNSRAFAIGADNTLEDIEIMKDGSVIGAGFANNTAGRRDGWIMRVTSDFILSWQAPYARGAASELTAITLFGKDQNYAAAVGTALPKEEGNRAGWVLAVEAAGGGVAWQRYFAGNLHFDGRDIMTSEEGLLSAILDGETPADSGEIEHIRLMTLNARGDLFASDEFYNGEGVDAVRLMETDTKNRLILGLTHVRERVGLMQEGDDAETKVTVDAWAVAAPQADKYEDPCVPKVRELP